MQSIPIPMLKELNDHLLSIASTIASPEIAIECHPGYLSECDGNIRWDDPEIGVEWPIEPVILSDKDVKAPTLKERMATSLNFVYEG